MEHITTFTGEDFKPLTPNANQIHIEDIAHALSLVEKRVLSTEYFENIVNTLHDSQYVICLFRRVKRTV